MNNIFAVLGVIFVTLKLTGTLAWSWLWITAPFWGPLAVALVLAIVAAIFTAVAKRQFKKLVNEDPFAAFDKHFKI